MKTWNKDLPNANFLGEFEDGSTEWHVIRSQGIGGSEIGTILGLNPWESAYTLFHKKLGLIDDSVGDNWAIRFGKAFESPILDLYAEEHKSEQIFRTGTFAHKEKHWMHANPDAISQQGKELKIVEVKTARSSWSELPPHYEAQVMWYMHVTGIRKAVVVGVNGMTYQEFEVEYDDFMGNLYEERAEAFWKNLSEQVAPDWDGSKSTFETVRQLHPEISDESVDLQSFGLRLQETHQRFTQAEWELNEIKSKVMAAMDKARYGYINTPDGKIVVAQRQSRSGGKPFLIIK